MTAVPGTFVVTWGTVLSLTALVISGFLGAYVFGLNPRRTANRALSRAVSATRNVVASSSRISSKNWKISFLGFSNGASAYRASRESTARRSHPISSLYRASWRRRPRSHRGCSRTSSISRRNARTSMMCTPFASPGSIRREVIWSTRDARLCSIER